MKIYLTGFMGSGKSTYGERLAKQLKLEFYDLDEMIEEKSGKSISELFDTEGESAFRELESKVLRETAELDKCIISTGGGTPCHSSNAEWMNENGKVIYLKLDEEKLPNRIQKSKTKRPLVDELKPNELKQFVRKKLKERAYYYHKAQIVISPQSANPKILAHQLREEL